MHRDPDIRQAERLLRYGRKRSSSRRGRQATPYAVSSGASDGAASDDPLASGDSTYAQGGFWGDTQGSPSSCPPDSPEPPPEHLPEKADPLVKEPSEALYAALQASQEVLAQVLGRLGDMEKELGHLREHVIQAGGLVAKTLEGTGPPSNREEKTGGVTTPAAAPPGSMSEEDAQIVTPIDEDLTD